MNGLCVWLCLNESKLAHFSWLHLVNLSMGIPQCTQAGDYNPHMQSLGQACSCSPWPAGCGTLLDIYSRWAPSPPSDPPSVWGRTPSPSPGPSRWSAERGIHHDLTWVCKRETTRDTTELNMRPISKLLLYSEIHSSSYSVLSHVHWSAPLSKFATTPLNMSFIPIPPHFIPNASNSWDILPTVPNVIYPLFLM